MNTKRYERHDTGAAQNKTGEAVTGIPIGENVPAGAPQFDAYIEAERKANEAARATEASGRMEDRDNRGADAVDGKGNIKPRIPVHEVDALAEEMAGRFANHIERVTSQLDGDTLTVTITTRHGVSKASADVDDWTAAGVKKALRDIEGKMNGKAAEQPADKLAEAVREVAKG